MLGMHGGGTRLAGARGRAGAPAHFSAFADALFAAHAAARCCFLLKASASPGPFGGRGGAGFFAARSPRRRLIASTAPR